MKMNYLYHFIAVLGKVQDKIAIFLTHSRCFLRIIYKSRPRPVVSEARTAGLQPCWICGRQGDTPILQSGDYLVHSYHSALRNDVYQVLKYP